MCNRLLFSTKTKREFDLKTHKTKEAVLKAIDRLLYVPGGSNTHLALDEMRTKSFLESNGARSDAVGHPRVAVILTDGKSDQPKLTASAAQKVQEEGITVCNVP